MTNLRIGSLTFEHPVLQAALSGYSDLPMRRIARLHGAVGTMNEVILDRVALSRGRKQRRILELAPDDHPIGGQLMGAEPEQVATAAALMAESGYDWVDINFGCPVRKVLRRRRGGYLLREPERAVAITQAVVEAVAGRCPVGVKLRRGYDDTTESVANVLRIVDGVFELGVDVVTVHPRTVEQSYLGRADWDVLTEVKRRVGDRVVLGSGDLFTAEDVVRMMEQTGVDGVMLARGCIGNPWLFGRCHAVLSGGPPPPMPTLLEQGRTIATHLGWMLDHYDRRRACVRMRKFGIAYSRLHPQYVLVRDALKAALSVDQWVALVGQWYRLPPEQSHAIIEAHALPGHEAS